MNKNNVNSILSTLTVGIMLCVCYFACATGTSVLPRGDSTATGIDLTVGGGGGDEMIDACIEGYAAEIISTKPVDVIFVIDNSGSMSEEIDMINKNINEHFAQALAGYGIDYRVIMLSSHGPGQFDICIEEPLGSIPLGGCEKLKYGDPPGNKPGQFYHYSYNVASTDSLCLILNTLTNVGGSNYDNFKLAPDGWIKWLRPTATKIFIEITDDTSGCAWFPIIGGQQKKNFSDFGYNFGGQIISAEWDKALTSIAPEQFGTVENRRYVFYSIIGMKEKPGAVDDDTGLSIDPNGDDDDPFLASEGIAIDICSTAVASGPTYQWLSKITGGLRFPICNANKIDVIFETIGLSIDSVTTTSCVIEVPASSNGGDIAIDTVDVIVEKNGGGTLKLTKVQDATACISNASNQYYVDAVDMKVVLCPATCLSVKTIAENIKLTADCISSIE